MDGSILTCSRALTDLTIGSSEFSREGTLISALPVRHCGTEFERWIFFRFSLSPYNLYVILSSSFFI